MILDLTPLRTPQELLDTPSGAVARFPDYPLLRIQGSPEVARDLLQRLCASDLRPLAVGRGPGQPALLLDRDGTLVDRLSIRLDDHGARIACTPERLDTVQHRITSMIFLEALEVLPDGLESPWLALASDPLPGAEFRMGPGLQLGQGPLPGVSGGHEPLQPDGALHWGRLLLRAGELPLWNTELALNPLYTNLAERVSFTKGCYPGQEVMARMDSRGRIGWRLAGLDLPGLPDGEQLFGGPDAQPARILGLLPPGHGAPARVLCLVRPDWTSVHCHIGGILHAFPLE